MTWIGTNVGEGEKPSRTGLGVQWGFQGHAFQWVLLGSSALVWSCTQSLAASQHRHCRRSMGNSDISARDVKQRGCRGSHGLCPQGPWPGSPEEQEDEASLSCSLVQ